MKIAFVHNRQRNKTLEEAEFDTPETISAIRRAIESGGHEVIEVEMTRQPSWVARLSEIKPDLIFNTAEGFSGVGREAVGPVLFEQLGIPYVGSGPYACFLTLDKYLTKQMVRHRDVPVADSFFVNRIADFEKLAFQTIFPAIVKPNYEGSSKGIDKFSLVHNMAELLAVGKNRLKDFPEGILVERFIPGRDVSVPFIAGLGDEGVLEPCEYVAEGTADSEWLYDYQLKNFEDEKVRVRCPADVSPAVRSQLISAMKRAVAVLGIDDFARADFRITPDGEIFFLEVNALPSLQPGAAIFEAAAQLNFDYARTLKAILETASTRLGLGGRRVPPMRRSALRKPRVALVYNLKRAERTDHNYEEQAEYDSEKTVNAIVDGIRGLGFEVEPLEFTRDLTESLKEKRIDIVFNIAEGSGKRTREAQVPALCDLLGIEHTGSDGTCLALTLDKAMTKRLIQTAGVDTPRFHLFSGPPGSVKNLKLRFPVIAKPNQEGTSKGIYPSSVVKDADALKELVAQLWDRYRAPVLCEEYIEGREFTIGVFGSSLLKVLGPMEIAFKPDAGEFPVYSFEAKQSDRPTDNEICRLECPVSLDPALDKKIRTFAKKVFRVLGCRDVARIDFKLGTDGKLYFLEVNPLPGLSPGYSDLIIMAERHGWSYTDVVRQILNPALQRWRTSARREIL